VCRWLCQCESQFNILLKRRRANVAFRSAKGRKTELIRSVYVSSFRGAKGDNVISYYFPPLLPSATAAKSPATTV
jgi:hypothetical protein